MSDTTITKRAHKTATGEQQPSPSSSPSSSPPPPAGFSTTVTVRKNTATEYEAIDTQTGESIATSTEDVSKVLRAAVAHITQDPKADGERLISIEPGVYMSVRDIQIGGKKNLTIQGIRDIDGNIPVLRGAVETNNILRQTGSGMVNFTLRDIELDGNDLLQIPAYFQGDNHGVLMERVYMHHSLGFVLFLARGLGEEVGVTLRDSHFAYSTAHDLVGSGGRDFLVERCLFENSHTRASEGFAINSGTNVTLRECTFRSPIAGRGFFGNGFHTEGTGNANIKILNNHFLMECHFAIDLGGTDVHPTKNTVFEVKGNYIDATPCMNKDSRGYGKTHGIRVAAGSDGVIENNTILNTGQTGILLKDCQNVRINNNDIRNGAWANASYTMGNSSKQKRGGIMVLNHPFRQFTSNRNISISLNTITNDAANFTAGIIIDNNYSAVNIRDNDLRNATEPKIYAIASDVFEAGNLL